jgi:hypothetical protein
MVEEPSRGEPPRRCTPEDIQDLVNAAEAICARRGLTPHEISVFSAVWSYRAFRELAACKGSFYELICGVENRLN